MKKNDLLKCGNTIIRVLEIQDDKAFIINCQKRNIPTWVFVSEIRDYAQISETELYEIIPMQLPNVTTMDAKSRYIINERYTMISGILPFVSDFRKRNQLLAAISMESGICRQTVLNYLCLYLTFQNKAVLAPKSYNSDTALSSDEKNYRWALNKFFYNQNKNSLKTTYTMMLKEKYCDTCGNLLPEYPTFNQFRYFYRKHKNMQNYYISRNGIKNYQRNHRPILGDGVQSFAPAVGVGMLDATICDIYLVNESGNLIGRPILTICIDVYSGLCCGYSISLEGGVYSLRGLMLNVIADKTEWCKRFGITIDKSDWNSDMLPATLVTDMGSEYKSENFEQIAELGVKIINLPPFRPELKGSVEKFFDVIQNLYKPYLKKKGVIEPDYQERGAHDYRKDACLTMSDFEKIIIRCIIYYNTKRIVANHPYSEKMIADNVQPYANCIFEYGKTQAGANLLPIDRESMILTLLPRTMGTFSRKGLRVNKMRYRHDGYTEKYLTGDKVIVAYNPDDVSFVWVIENGAYVRFELIESRYCGKKLSDVETLQCKQKNIIQSVEAENTQAQIDLANHILTIAQNAVKYDNVSIKHTREARQRERNKNHIDYMKAGVDYE